MQNHTLTTLANRGGIKTDVKEYDGSEAKSLLKCFCEMDQAKIARQYTDERIQVSFMMSKLTGRAYSWAYGPLLPDPNSFPTIAILNEKLRLTFEPPQNELEPAWNSSVSTKAKTR
uniref:AlNc14C264G9866 protein n=1 Tax=Albugo laibachii Nc14 TaxID=890382 RepID=F0WU43_9STRA|nr:AlNc14C264G9866 [Albugo laibachii Nc14]|eukprot:CCA24888.1 AlNc14C264G9866 [Albugo laibachii Nc14]